MDADALNGYLAREDGLGRDAQLPPLSERELEVLRLVAEGHTNEEIGRQLFITTHTVISHTRHVLAKLEARSRAHAVALGFRGALLG
jgi:DNA-binding CsgD family transcriptional regulator